MDGNRIYERLLPQMIEYANDGKGYGEIAEILDMEISTVRSYLNKAGVTAKANKRRESLNVGWYRVEQPTGIRPDDVQKVKALIAVDDQVVVEERNYFRAKQYTSEIFNAVVTGCYTHGVMVRYKVGHFIKNTFKQHKQLSLTGKIVKNHRVWSCNNFMDYSDD